MGEVVRVEGGRLVEVFAFEEHVEEVHQARVPPERAQQPRKALLLELQVFPEGLEVFLDGLDHGNRAEVRQSLWS